MISGPRKYYSIIRHAFHNYKFSRAFDDRKNRYAWGVYVYDVDDNVRPQIVNLLKLLEESVCIDDALSQTFALSYHSQSTFEGIGKTEMGKLVRSAKPYHEPPSEKQMAAAVRLAEKYEQFILSHPSYLRSDYFVPVPGSTKKPFDLPTFLTEHLCQRLNIKNGIHFIARVGSPKPMKDYKTVKDKSQNIRGAFKVTNSGIFTGRLVTILDDIYESGATLHELATTLQDTGATVQGLVATKTLKNPS